MLKGFMKERYVSRWTISQREWSSVGQCEKAKRGFVILYGQWDTAKCLSEDTVGQVRESETHTETLTHNSRNPTASSLVILIVYSNRVLL